jgi:hypothetical protein
MSSIICNRNGVIEVSLGSSKPARRRRPSKDILNSQPSGERRPYGEAVQSNVLYVTLDIRIVEPRFGPDVTLLPARFFHGSPFTGRLPDASTA